MLTTKPRQDGHFLLEPLTTKASCSSQEWAGEAGGTYSGGGEETAAEAGV